MWIDFMLVLISLWLALLVARSLWLIHYARNIYDPHGSEHAPGAQEAHAPHLKRYGGQHGKTP